METRSRVLPPTLPTNEVYEVSPPPPEILDGPASPLGQTGGAELPNENDVGLWFLLVLIMDVLTVDLWIVADLMVFVLLLVIFAF